MIIRSLFSLIICIFSLTVMSQTLTISSGGQTGTSGTNWSISGTTLTVTGTANINSSVLATALSNGSLTVVGNTNTFDVTISQSLTSTTSGNGLTIGSTSNTSAITVGSEVSIKGPITIYGGAIALNANITSTGTNADVLIKGTTNVNLGSSAVITTAGGKVSLWSDSDDNATGYVQLKENSSIATNGGDISLGGGANLTSDYAFGTSAETCPENLNTQYISGIHMRTGSQLNSNGGNISLRGQNANTANAAMSFGISFRGVVINSGPGKININGVATGSGNVNGQGVSSWGTLTLRSSNSTVDAISITGDASGVNNSSTSASLGINCVALFEATGIGGGITINGKGGVSQTVVGANISGDILAASGTITIIGESTNNVLPINLGNTNIGKKASTNVTTSSSNVIFEANTFAIGNVLVDCSGTFTIRSLGTGFPSAFSWPVTNLSLASSVSGLTVGKTTNTVDVTIGSATSINGPINIYAGNINLNQNLISSASNQSILLKATGNILLANGKIVQSNGGNIIFWSDSDNNNSGGIRVDDNATIDARTNTDRTNTAHTTGGGKVIFAGGLDDGGTASGTSSLLTGLVANDGIPDGYAVNSGSSATQSGIVLGTSTSGTGHNCGVSVYSGSGEIKFQALATNNSSAPSSGPTGLLFYEGYTINSGTSGNITLLGNSNLTSGGWAIGMDLAAWRTSTASANGTTRTVNGNINIIGRAAGGTSGNIAIAIDGDGNRHIFAATGSGTISVDGLASGVTQTDVRLTNVDMLAASGAIILTSKGNSGVNIGGYAIGNGLYLGKKAGSLVTSSTSNISIISNNLSTSSKPLVVDGTGEFVIEPYSSSFASDFTLNTTQTLASTLGGLRIGKSGNSANITVSNAQSINGPITLYGGTISVNANLNATLNGAAILLQGIKLVHSQGITVQTVAGNITYTATNSPWTANADQSILVGGLTGTTTTINAQGGNISMSGTFATTGVTNTSTNSDVAIYLRNSTVKTSGSGTISMNGNAYENASTSGDFIWGVVLFETNLIQTASGNISITGTPGKIRPNGRGVVADGSTLKILSSSGAINITDAMPAGHTLTNYSGAYFKPASASAIRFGADGSLVTSSSSDIIFDVDYITFDVNPTILSSTGLLTIRPVATSFATSYTVTNLTIPTTLTGFTLGKIGNAANITIGSATSINGPITLYGGTLGLSAALTTTNTSTGNIGLNGTTLSGNANLTVAAGRTATVNLSSAASYSGIIAGSTSNFVKSGIGTLTLTGANSFDGTTTVSAGGLILNRTGGSTLASAGDLALSGGNLTVSSTQTLNDINVNSGTLTTDAGISFTVDGTYAGGGTLANNGTLILLGPASLPGGPFMAVPVSFPGSTTTITSMNNLTINNLLGVELDKDLTVSGTLSLAAGTFDIFTKTLTISGTVTRSTGAIDGDQGNVVFSNASDISLPASLFSGTVATLSKSSGAGTVTMNDHLTVTGNMSTTASTGAWITAASKQLTVNGTLTNNGTFTMKDGATFVQATSGTSVTGTGTYNVEKALASNSSTWSTTSGRFWYMGVPMVSVARSGYGIPGTTTNRVWSYSEATKSYTELSDGNALLSAGTGYVHRRSTDGTLTFTAIGANGLYGSDYSVSGLTKTAGYTSGVNLVSNPYMGYLDWNAVYNASTNIDPTFYIRSNNTSSNNINALISYNGSTQNYTNTSSVTITNASQIRYIAPMQSVWVKVGSSGSTGTVNMTRGMLSHQSGNSGLKSSTVFPTLARVNLVDGNQFDQLLVYMNSDMSNEVDQFDSEKLPVSGTVQLYTMASNKKLVMNGLKNNKKKVSIPLYLELPTSKSYTLNLSEYVLDNGLILLEDKQEGTIQDLTLLENYTFYANSGMLQNRFVLHFILPDAEFTNQGPSNSWVGPETSYTEGGNVQITNDDRGNIQITVDQPEVQKVEGNVSVTDMNGKEVYRGQLDGITTAVELNVPAGIYYLTVQSGALFEKKKVFIQD